MPCRILFVEDSPHKQARVIEYVEGVIAGVEICLAKSFSSGCRELESSSFDFVLIDMSLPTYDKEGAESGGNFRPFGGREIARKMKRKGVSTKIVFITQYEAFSDRGRSYSFEELREELRAECGELFGGMVYFDSSKVLWKDELQAALRGAS
jgi:CheY-like chemotaxis protein